MKRYIFIAFLFAAATAFCQSPMELAGQGDDSYRMGEYQAAIESYEAVLAAGQTSAELYYNLGNAYYREGQMAKAILNYERALHLKPNMSDAKENLALANSHITDRITVLPQLFIGRWIDALCTTVTPHAWRIILLILIAIAGIAVMLLRWGSNTSLRKTGLAASIVTAVLIVATTPQSARPVSQASSSRQCC